MSYLQRLKAINSKDTATQGTVKTVKSPSGSFGGSQGEHFPKIEVVEAIFGEVVTDKSIIGKAITSLETEIKHQELMKTVIPILSLGQITKLDVWNDDRRHCRDCLNLTSRGRCLAAWRGDIQAGSQYYPVDDLPRRCQGFVPSPTDPDQRTGKERWPAIDMQHHQAQTQEKS